MFKKQDSETFVLKSCDPKKFISYKFKNRKPQDPFYIEGLDLGNRKINKFVEYNEFEKKITKVAKRHNKIDKSSTFDKCGSRKIINKTKLSKIKETKDKSYKSYLVHNNYERPFLVYIKNKEVFIYTRNTDLYYFLPECDSSFSVNYNEYGKHIRHNNGYNKLIKKYKNLKNIFVGKSPKNEMTISSGGYGKKWDGNTILLHIKNNEYVFIGTVIFKFKALSEIIKYVSPIGNNDVPCPYAIDKENNTYILLGEYLYIYKNIPKRINTYDYYYNIIENDFKFTEIKTELIHKTIYE